MEILKKWILCTLLCAPLSTIAQFISPAPVLNNTISAAEYGGAANTWNDGGRTWFMAWDATNLYIGIENNGNPANDEFVIYIDTDPSIPVNGSTGSIDGIGNFDNNNYGRLPFSANFCAFVRNSYHQHRTSSGTWSAANNDNASIQRTNNPNRQEVSIAWSLMGGRPASFNFFIYLNGGNPYGGNSLYNVSGDNDQGSNLNLTGRRYFQVASTDNVPSPGPFSRVSYTNPRSGYNTINDYGSSFYDVTINANGSSITSSLTAATTINGSLYIGGQDILDMNTNNIDLKGNINRQQPVGALIDMGLFSLTGTTDQIQTGNITYLGGLTVNKATGKVLLTSNGNNAGIIIDNNSTLTLTQGKIDARTNNTLVEIKNGASITAGNANSYVNGRLQIYNIGGTTKTFPVGNSTFNPATIVNAGTADNFDIVVGDYLTSDGTATGTQGTYGVVNRTWDVNETVSGGSNVTLNLQWNSAEELLFSNTSCYVGHYTGGNWQPTAAAAATGAGGAGPFTRSRNNITSFSPFGLASIGALPLDLTHFTITKTDAGNLIQWQTVNEQNNKGYFVQKSTDGIHFTNLQFIPSALTRAGNNYNYSSLDANNNAPKTFYRLQLLELTGTISYSKVLRISNDKQSIFEIWKGTGNHTFQIKTELKNKGSLSLFRTNGQLVETIMIQKGSSLQVADWSKHPAGLYFTVLTTMEEKQQTKRIILE